MIELIASSSDEEAELQWRARREGYEGKLFREEWFAS